MSKFCVGDRVVCIIDYPDGNRDIKAGTTGTVVDVSRESMRVKVHWDLTKPSEQAHSCGGRCPIGYGWNVHYDEVIHENVDLTELCQAEICEVESFLFGGVISGR